MTALLLIFACTAGSKVDTGGGTGGSGGEPSDTGSGPVAPQPIEVDGWGTDQAIAVSSGMTQGEPAAVATPDGTIVASWMQTMDDGSSLYVVLTRSTDGGSTWSEPTTVDEDRWGWQNDPDFVYANGRILYTWLAIESRDASQGSIYCIESSDSGATWSDKVKLSTESDSVDREWMATDGSDHVVITWDSFSGSYHEDQVVAETSSGCSGFSTPEVIASGTFLNGVPAIDTDGNVWASRNAFQGSYIKDILSQKTDAGWVDTKIQSYDYPSGAYYAMYKDSVGEDADEHHLDEDGGDADGGDADGGTDLSSVRLLHVASWRDTPFSRATAKGTYQGEYSPILAASPNGGLVIVTLATEDTNPKYADVNLIRYKDGVMGEPMVLNQDGGGSAQMEPWVIADAGGGVHVTWYDGREDAWRLYSADSVDDGVTFNEQALGDNTFNNGFDETGSAYYAWVGHFQSIVESDGHIVAVFGDSHTSNRSRIYTDISQAR